MYIQLGHFVQHGWHCRMRNASYRQYCAQRWVVSMICGIIAVALSLMRACIHSTAWPSSKSSRSFSWG